MQCDIIAHGLHARGHDVVYIAPNGNGASDYNKNYRVIPVENSASSISDAVIAFAPEIVYWRYNKYHFNRAVKKISASKISVIFAVSHISDTKLWSSRENFFRAPFKYLKQGLQNLYNHAGFSNVRGLTVNNSDYLGLLPVNPQSFIANAVTAGIVPFSWPRPFVVWIANIKPHKQPEKFVELAKEFPNMDFLMVGSMQDESYRWIENESGARNFYYLGAKTPEEVNGILAQSLFLIHTCKPEGFCNNMIQAWLQKKPVVTLAFDPAGYIRKHGLGAFAHNDWKVFVEQVDEYLRDPSLREQVGERAQAFAKITFSAEQSVQKLESLMFEILGKTVS